MGTLFANPYFGANNVLIQLVDNPLMDNKARQPLAYMGHKAQHHPQPSDPQVLSPFRVRHLHPQTRMVYHKERQLEDNRHQVHHLEHKIHMEYHKEHQLVPALRQVHLDSKTHMEVHKDLQLEQTRPLEESHSQVDHQDLIVHQTPMEHPLALQFHKEAALLLTMEAPKF